VCDEDIIYLHRPGGALVKVVLQSGWHSEVPDKEILEAPHGNDTLARHAADIMRLNDYF
jgi:hypothetical protein